MKYFIYASFWIGLTVITLRVLILSFSDYPRERKISIGEDMAGLIMSTGILTWASLLLWG